MSEYQYYEFLAISAIVTRQPPRYDEAVELLKDLRAVSEGAQRLDVFEQCLEALRRRQARKRALLQRLERADLGTDPPKDGARR